MSAVCAEGIEAKGTKKVQSKSKETEASAAHAPKASVPKANAPKASALKAPAAKAHAPAPAPPAAAKGAPKDTKKSSNSIPSILSLPGSSKATPSGKSAQELLLLLLLTCVLHNRQDLQSDVPEHLCQGCFRIVRTEEKLSILSMPGIMSLYKPL